jgi:Leucine-rich repeat (LRR) protein
LIDINALNLEEFFKALSQLPKLKELYLYDLKVNELPLSFYDLCGIEKIKIYDCIHLVTVTDKISSLKNLIYFEIWNTSVTAFPKICTSNLKSLIIGKNGNMKMPIFDSKFYNIEYLVISNMDLNRKTINEISRIKSLRTIKLFNCNLRRFPYCLSKCPNLALLMLSGNNIKRISKSLKNFESLEELDLDLNPLAQHLKKMLHLGSKYEFSITFSLLPQKIFDTDKKSQ